MKHVAIPPTPPVNSVQADDRLLSSARWFASAAVITAVHAGIAWWAIHHAAPLGSAGFPDQPVMIEMEPMAVPAEAAPDEAPPTPEMQEPLPEPTPVEETPPPETEPPVEPPVENPPAEPEPETPPEAVLEAEPEQPPPEPEIPPPLPPTPPVEAEAILPPPPKPAPKPPPKKVVDHKPKPVAPRQPPRPAPAPRTAPNQGTMGVSAATRASWHNRVSAHLNRYKRPVRSGPTGVARVTFRVNASGHVVSASLVSSSGDAALDQETLALIRRASPLPAPPPEMGAVSLTVPVRFTR